MIGDDFSYGDFWLSDFNMSMLSPEESQQFVGRNIEKSEITSLRAKPLHYGATYADTLILHFLIVKTEGICGTEQEQLIMKDSEIHDLRRWLESPKLPVHMEVSLSGEHDIITHYFGLFTDVQPYMIGSHCCGLNLTFTCDSPYGYSGINSTTYKINKLTSVVSGTYINGSAELNEYLMPTIEIVSTSTFGSNEKITITNTTDGGKKMILNLPAGKKKLIIDCQKKQITDENGKLITLSTLGYTLPIDSAYSFVATESYAFNWLGLLPGVNKITFKGSSPNTLKIVTLSSRDILKTGGF